MKKKKNEKCSLAPANQDLTYTLPLNQNGQSKGPGR